MRLEGQGLSIEIPLGWEGRISRRDLGQTSGPGLAIQAEATASEATTGALLQAANFELPPSTGDFGSGAVEVMRSRDLLLILFEYDRSSAAQPLFAAAGVPRLSHRDFSPATLQRTIHGQSGVQRFFRHSGRALCLYVVLGSHVRRVGTVPQINDVLATLEIR